MLSESTKFIALLCRAACRDSLDSRLSSQPHATARAAHRRTWRSRQQQAHPHRSPPLPHQRGRRGGDGGIAPADSSSPSLPPLAAARDSRDSSRRSPRSSPPLPHQRGWRGGDESPLQSVPVMVPDVADNYGIDIISPSKKRSIFFITFMRYHLAPGCGPPRETGEHGTAEVAVSLPSLPLPQHASAVSALVQSPCHLLHF